MNRVQPGRMTHDYDGELVVFLIGMTINHWWQPGQWIPVFQEMPKMLAELSRNHDSGLLGYRLVFDPRGPWVVQYWNSLDKLYSYASEPDGAHRPAWRRFNRRARSAAGAVGIWHETYVVNRAESVYVHAPLQGLAKATGIRPVTARLHTARSRIAGG